jgi:hypothetical protein
MRVSPNFQTGFFFWDKAGHKNDIDLHLELDLYLHFPIFLHGMCRDNFTGQIKLRAVSPFPFLISLLSPI